jgi:hypothetical protein
MLLFAALLILGIGGLVAASGEERRVRLWFGLLCIACATVCIGLFVETRFEPWALLAARVNMTAAFAATTCGLVSVAVMCRMPVAPIARVVIALAALANLVTVWSAICTSPGSGNGHPPVVCVCGRSIGNAARQG